MMSLKCQLLISFFDKCIQIWNNSWVSNWWENFHSLVEYTFNTHNVRSCLCLTLMLTQRSTVGSVQVKAPETTVTLQEGMILDCLCPWSGQLTMVSWNKASLSQPVAVYHPQLGTNFAPSYDGRVAFLKTTPMDGSISIMNVSQSDVGQYYCSLQTYPQGSWTKKTFVKKSGEECSKTYE